MDNEALRDLAMTISTNRNTSGGDKIIENARKLFDWMTARGEKGEQCVMRANNAISAQSSVDSLLDRATEFYAFQTDGDGSPVEVKSAKPKSKKE